MLQGLACQGPHIQQPTQDHKKFLQYAPDDTSPEIISGYINDKNDKLNKGQIKK